MDRPALVSIALPVFNGERFIREAIDSLLRQTYTDLELIIFDNASTDSTQRICLEYAAKDPRVRYTRNAVNVGAAPNHNLAFHASRGVYFKWAAHDDVCAPTFVERCIEVLERDPSIVLCSTRTKALDPGGGIIDEVYDFPMRISSARANERFRDLICVEHPCNLAFGIARREALLKTPLMGSYVGSDRNLVAELSLLGRVHEVDEYLFFQRQHAGRSMVACAQPRLRRTWFDPSKDRLLHLPTWRTGWEYSKSVARTSLRPAQRFRCFGAVAEWSWRHRGELVRDLQSVAIDVARWTGVWRPRQSDWEGYLSAAKQQLAALSPRTAPVVLVDDTAWGMGPMLEGRPILPFLERDGYYFGTPPDSEAAIAELERMRTQHAPAYIVFPSHSAWWFDHFPAFHRHLRRRYSQLKADKRLIIFDLRAAP